MVAALVNNRSLLISTLIVVMGAIIYEISLSRISRFSFAFTGSAETNLVAFVVLVIVFAVGQHIMLYWMKRKVAAGGVNRSRFGIVLNGVRITQGGLILILVLVIIQILTLDSYSLTLVIVFMWTAYGLATLMLTYLVWKFFKWFSDNRSFIVLGYLVAILVLVSNLVITNIYTTQILITQPSSVMKNVGHRNPIPPQPIASAFFYSDIISFAGMWIASSVLLQRFTTLNKYRYWLLMTIPLIYYLAQFQPIFITLFSDYILSDPIGFSTSYTVVFTAIEPIGGFLFGLAFWTIARKLESKTAKDYLFISGAGLLLFFASNQAAALVNYPFPPFGMVAISYLGLSSYLILTGIHFSAISVAQDDKLRRSIRDSVTQQRTNLLGDIGTSEMRDRVYKRALELSKDLSDLMEKETYVSPTLTGEQVKSYIDEVMKEKGIFEKEK